MAPNNVLRHADDPARHSGIAGINKLPPPPHFGSRSWADRIGIIVCIATVAVFVSVVTLARIKGVIRMVFSDIGLERPVLIGSQTSRRSRFSKRNNMEINQIRIITGRMGIKFSLRDFLSVAPGHRHSFPMGAQIYQIKKSSSDGKEFARRSIVLRLEDDEKGTVFANRGTRLSRASPQSGRIA